MLNYESELSDLLLSQLQKIYGVDKSVVYQYFLLRLLIEYEDKSKIKQDYTNLLIQFLIRELNLPIEDNCFVYKEERVQMGFSIENSLKNIVINWGFQSSLKDIVTSKGVAMPFKEYIKNESKKYVRHGKNKAKGYKGQACYYSYLKWNALELLNKQYLANPKTPEIIEGIHYPEYHHIFVRTLEEIYTADIHSVEYMTSNTLSISEQDLENYLIKHLYVVEEGLHYVDRQVSIRDGRIDILARDREGQYVILELKVQEDKELLWQCLYYPMMFKEKECLEKVRMIVVLPECPPHILRPLLEVKEVEIVEFKPIIELGRIKDLQIIKIR